MTDDEINKAWSRSVASLAVDELVRAKIVALENFDRAIEIAAEEIFVRLCAQDRPDRTNWRYISD